MNLIKYLLGIYLLLASAMAYSGQIMVAGAASLTDAFRDLATQYTAQNPDTEILTTFGASDTVLQQILHGAPADVFASADQQTMDKAVAANAVLSSSRVNFTSNKLVLITPKDAPIESLVALLDLATTKDDLRIAFGNPATVPAGRYTKIALEQLNAWSTVESRQILGQNVRQVLAYVKRGEVDAGFVFGSDAYLFKNDVHLVEEIPLPEKILYPMALVKSEQIKPEAQGFVDYVLSEAGQAIMAKYGFTNPK